MPTGAEIVFKEKINAVITELMKGRITGLENLDAVHQADVIRLALARGLDDIEGWTTADRLAGYRAQTPRAARAHRLPRRLSKEDRAELLAARLITRGGSPAGSYETPELGDVTKVLEALTSVEESAS